MQCSSSYVGGKTFHISIVTQHLKTCDRFPRHWKKGNAADIAEYEQDKRDKERYLAMIAEQRRVQEGDANAPPAYDNAQLEAGVPKPVPRVYVPPVAGY